jgi:hypothetical protein
LSIEGVLEVVGGVGVVGVVLGVVEVVAVVLGVVAIYNCSDISVGCCIRPDQYLDQDTYSLETHYNSTTVKVVKV